MAAAVFALHELYSWSFLCISMVAGYRAKKLLLHKIVPAALTFCRLPKEKIKIRKVEELMVVVFGRAEGVETWARKINNEQGGVVGR